MRNTILTPFLLFLILILSAASNQAQNDSLRTRSVLVFSNGTGFFKRSGKVPVTNSKYLMESEIPQALWGTFWFNAPGAGLKKVSSVMAPFEQKLKASTMLMLLSLNVDKNLRLYYGDTLRAEGVLLQASQELVLLHTETEWLSIPFHLISRIEYLEEPANEVIAKSEKRILEFEFNSGQKLQQLEMMYLHTGIGWLANYRLSLLSENKATLQLRALLMNEVEDLEDVEFRFVIGQPGLVYGSQLSPLINYQPMINLLGNIVAPVTNTGTAGYIVYNDMALEEIDVYQQNFIPQGQQAVLGGNFLEDLYFYDSRKLSLPKGARTITDLFVKDLDIRHFYEANLVQNGVYRNYYQNLAQQMQAQTAEVWHVVEIDNKQEFPLTAGSVLVMGKEVAGEVPVSQSRVPYTAAGGKGEVRLGKSPEVKVEEREEEESRAASAIYRDAVYYDHVHAKSTITVNNYFDKEITLVLRKVLNGKALESSEPWKNTKRVSSYYGVNPVSDLEWEISLQPGEEKELSFSYEVYIR